MLYFNVRNFKAVNELFGIDTGDSVLRTIYKNLRSSSLKPCVVARVEADQFTCLVEKKIPDFASGISQRRERRCTSSAVAEFSLLKIKK